MESIGTPIKGIYRDILKGPANRVILDSGWVANTIVDRCRILLAGFVKNESTHGLTYLAVGRGQDGWDDLTRPLPVPDPATTTDLERRYEPTIPVADLQLVYLGATDEEVAGPTSRLQITARLRENYPQPIPPFNTYPLREFGLFARFGGADYMINCVRHPLIQKDASTSLIRVIRLYF